MSGVHKSERKESRFEVMEHAVFLKRKIRELSIIRNFGYRVRESKEPRNFQTWSEKSRATWKKNEEIRLKKLEWLDRAYLAEKRKAIDADVMAIIYGITDANSIKRASSLAECDERRAGQNRAIAACERLLADLQDIMDTLPIDKNWMTHIAPEIDLEIRLLRAWKKSDNETRRSIREMDMKKWVLFLKKCMEKESESELLTGIYHAYQNALDRFQQAEKPEAKPEP